MAKSLDTPFDFDVGDPEGPSDGAFFNMSMETLESDIPTAGDEDQKFTENLAERLAIDDPEFLKTLASELLGDIDRDIESRAPFDRLLESGMKLLGFDREEDRKSDPFPGSFAAYHPVMAQAIVDYEARAIKELFPPNGPVKTKIVGIETPEKRQKSERVAEYMNWQLTEQMPEYPEDLEKTLMMQALSGDAFKKMFWDPTLQRPRSDFVASNKLFVPYSATSLATAPRITHELDLTEGEWKRNQVAGLWRNIEFGKPTPQETDRTKQKLDRWQGRTNTGSAEDDQWVFYETCTELDVPGDEHPEGLPRDYVVTLHPQTREVVAIRRNWRQNDALERRRLWYAQYGLIPWDGFYHLGFVHMIGGLARGATGAMRLLFDSGTLSSMPPMVRLRGTRISNSELAFRPMQATELDAPGCKDVREIFQTLQVAEPSSVMFQLLGSLIEAGQSFATVATMSPSDTANTPASSVLAQIEQGSMVFGQIHARNHRSQGQELKLLAELNYEHLDDQVTIRTFNGELLVAREDFNDDVAIVPVSDPNIFSQIQRAQRAQAQLDLVEKATSAGVHSDVRQAFVDVAHTLNLPNADDMFPAPQQAQPLDPVSEIQALVKGAPVQAFPGQNHMAHVQFLMSTAQDPQYAPLMQMIGPRLQSLLADHLALQRRQEVEQQLGQPLPPPGTPLPPQIEFQISQASAQAAGMMSSQRQQQAAQQAQQQPQNPADMAKLALEHQKAQDEAANDQRQAQLQAANDQREAEMDQARFRNEQTQQAEESRRADQRAQADAIGDQKDREIEAAKIAADLKKAHEAEETKRINALTAAQASIITTAMTVAGVPDVPGPVGATDVETPNG